MNTTLQLQLGLQRLGFDPGPIDGIPGRRTQAAVRSYQASRGLVPDGIVGTATLNRLSRDGVILTRESVVPGVPVPITASLTPWLDEARRWLGIREISGPASNPSILGWATRLGKKTLGMDYRDDDTPWCGLFVAHCISVTLPEEPLPAVVVRASSWSNFGVSAPAPFPLGAVAVFTRPGGNHVMFLNGWEGGRADHPEFFHGIGGNTGNRVSQAKLESARLVSVQWPKTVPYATRHLPRMVGGKVSTNEA